MCNLLWTSFEYNPPIFYARNKIIGFIHRLAQLLIIIIFAGFAVVYKTGYQEYDDVVSVSSTKVKGTIYTSYSELSPNSPLHNRIWDVADYVMPPEDPSIQAARCENDSDCKAGEPVPNGNGVRTGVCVQSADNRTKVCEVYAWCPVENNMLPVPLANRALLEDSKRFTVLINNNIQFPKFNFAKRNILDSQDKDYLKRCRYNASDKNDHLCPIFQLDTIVAGANQDYCKIAVQGGVIQIGIEWNCNLDKEESECRPKYKFARLDRATEMAKIAPGWNFRYADYYWVNGTKMRDFYKAIGIRFVINVTGQARKFSGLNLVIALGSGFGWLVAADYLCQFFLCFLMEVKYHKKFGYVEETTDSQCPSTCKGVRASLGEDCREMSRCCCCPGGTYGRQSNPQEEPGNSPPAQRDNTNFEMETEIDTGSEREHNRGAQAMSKEPLI